MNDKITLKFQKLHLVTTLGWVLILFLALMSRGVLSSFGFWVILIVVVILFVLDVIYFIIHVIEGPYLLITNRKVIIKRFLKPIESMVISELKSITVVNNTFHNKRVILSNGERELEIKHIYKISKESIILTIQQSNHYPKNLEITRK